MKDYEEVINQLMYIQNRHFRYFMSTKTAITDYVLITHHMHIRIIRYLPAEINNDVAANLAMA